RRGSRAAIRRALPDLARHATERYAGGWARSAAPARHLRSGMLHIQTFDARAGGNVLYKALAHPLAAEGVARLGAKLAAPYALYDPDNIADALFALYPDTPRPCALLVHDVAAVGSERVGMT